MAITYESMKSYAVPEVTQTLNDHDCILYALGVGYGAEPEHPGHLRYVYEDGLEVLPMMANVTLQFTDRRGDHASHHVERVAVTDVVTADALGDVAIHGRGGAERQHRGQGMALVGDRLGAVRKKLRKVWRDVIKA